MSDTVPTGTPMTPLSSTQEVLSGVSAGQPAGSTASAYVAAPTGGFIRRWIHLARPRLLLLGVAPAAATLALLWASGTHLIAVPAVFSILAVALVQAGANLLDEHLEFERYRRYGAALDILSDGDVGALLASSGIPPLDALRAGIGLLIAGALAGIPLVISGGVSVAVLGAFGLAAAFLYSSTTYALKRLPVGELVVLLAFGPGIAAAVALAQRARVSAPALLAGCALGLLALALAVALQVSGLERNERMGRRSLASYIGLRGCRLLYAVCLIGAFVLVALVALPKGAPYGALAALLALPAALVALTGVLRARPPAARALLPRQTVRVYAFFAVWLVVGLLASGIVARIVAIAVKNGA